MNHGLHAVLAQQAGDQLPVTDVAHHQGRVGHRLPEAARQIIQNDDRFATFTQLQDHMAADISRAARDQNRTSTHVRLASVL